MKLMFGGGKHFNFFVKKLLTKKLIFAIIAQPLF